uniref:Uncharacterized protein n=1 Tax=Oryzias melastigma TaxID=30732 RepID=A0A3B3DUG1_ORYME
MFFFNYHFKIRGVQTFYCESPELSLARPLPVSRRADTAAMGPSATPLTECDRMLKPKGAVVLPQHSYWFDFWVFVLLNVALFIFVYFVVP